MEKPDQFIFNIVAKQKNQTPSSFLSTSLQHYKLHFLHGLSIRSRNTYRKVLSPDEQTFPGWEEAWGTWPASQSGWKDFTWQESRHLKTLQCQGQPETEEQTGDNAEENSTATTARIQLWFALQKTTAFCLLCLPAAPLGKARVIFACPLQSPCPTTALCSSPSLLPAVAFPALGNVPLSILLLFDIPQLHQVVQRDHLQPFTGNQLSPILSWMRFIFHRGRGRLNVMQ